MDHRLARLERMLPGRAAAIEAAGRLPDDVLAELRAAGCLRLTVAARHGGDDVSLAELVQVLRGLGRLDATTSWVVGQLALSHVLLGHLPAATAAALYADGPDVLVAGAAAPKGRAVRRGDDWVVSGRWPMVSGALDARWVFVQCLALEDAGASLDGELPRLRLALLPAGQVRVHETWDALGLRGTGSHDVEVRRGLCAHACTCDLAIDRPGPARVSRIRPAALGGPLIAATALGIAQGGMEDVAALARSGKRPAFSTRRLAEQPRVRARLGRAAATLAAGGALLSRATSRAEALAAAGTLDELERARLRAAAVKCVDLAAEALDEAYAIGGTSVIAASSPLQRRLRDLRTARQHYAVGHEFYGPLGALLVGEEPDVVVDRPAPKYRSRSVVSEAS